MDTTQSTPKRDSESIMTEEQKEVSAYNFIELVIENDQLINLRGNVSRHENEDYYVLFPDVENYFRKRKITAHKSVLRNFSSRIKYMIAQEPEQLFDKNHLRNEEANGHPSSRYRQLNTESVNADQFGRFLNFFYTGKIEFFEKDFFKYFYAAEYLGISIFCDKAKLYFEEKILSTRTVIDCLFQQLSSLKIYIEFEESNYFVEKCLLFLAQNYVKVFKTYKFFNLPFEVKDKKDVCALLNRLNSYKSFKYLEVNSSDLKNQIREVSFHALTSWIRHSDRLQKFVSLFHHIEFEKLSSNFFHQIITQTPELSESSIQCELLIEVNTRMFKSDSPDGFILNLFEHICSSVTQSKMSRLFIEELVISSKHDHYVYGDRYAFLSSDGLKKILANSGADINETERLFCLGGLGIGQYELPSVSQYESVSGWSKWCSMLDQRYDFAAATDSKNRSKIYVCGGRTAHNGMLASLHVHELETEHWKALKPLPEPRCGCSIVFLDGYLYLAGGETEKHVPLKTCYRYSPRTDSWSSIQQMTHPRSGLKLIAMNGHLYAIGGFTNSVERYDPNSDTWTMMPKMNNIQVSSGAVAHQGILFVCGPENFQAFIPETRMESWVTLPAPDVGLGAELVSFNGRLLAVGGCGHGRVSSNEVFEFKFAEDIHSCRWIPFDRIDVERAFHCAVVVGGAKQKR